MTGRPRGAAPAPVGQATDPRAALQLLVRRAEELRRRSTLADARGGFEGLYAQQHSLLDRLTALDATVVCRVPELRRSLEAAEVQYFAPDVSRAIYDKIDETSAELTSEASAIAAAIDGDERALIDPRQPAAMILEERIDGLERRIDDAVRELRGMFTELEAAHRSIRRRVEGLEKTALAVQASGLDAGQFQACVTFSRKVSIENRGPGYLTLAGQQVFFQAVHTSGFLFWTSDEVGPAEVTSFAGPVSLTNIQRQFLVDDRATLRLPPPAPSIALSLGGDDLDDLIDATGDAGGG